MQTPRTWVTPCDVSARDLRALQKVLTTEGIESAVVPPEVLAEQLGQTPRPLMVIVRAHLPSIEVVEMLRRLADQQFVAVAIVDTLSEEREVMLLRSGALDVVRLPISVQLLSARIRRLHDYLARRGGSAEYEFEIDGILLRPAFREVWVDNQSLALTKTEYRLLSALIREPRRILTRQELALVATEGGPMKAHALQSHLSRVRSKILAAGGPRLITPVRGVGYRLLIDRPVA